MLKPVCFVDNLSGDDNNDGTISRPLATLKAAYDKVNVGGKIVLQTGSGQSYGDLLVEKNISIVASSGSLPVVGSIEVEKAQVYLKGLTLEPGTTRIRIAGNGSGNSLIDGILADGVLNPIQVEGLRSLTVRRCTFKSFNVAILVKDTYGVVINNNLFDRGSRSVSLKTSVRIDIRNNTIVGSTLIGASASDSSGGSLRVIYITLKRMNIEYKRVSVPTKIHKNGKGQYAVAVSVITGPSLEYGSSYNVVSNGGVITWEGTDLEDLLEVGETLRISYVEDSEDSGTEALKIEDIVDTTSLIDSNIFVNHYGVDGEAINSDTPIRIRYNDFYEYDQPFRDTSSSDNTGNINDDPSFVSLGGIEYVPGDSSQSSTNQDPDIDTIAYNDVLAGKYPSGTILGRRRDIRSRHKDDSSIGAVDLFEPANPISEAHVKELSYVMDNDGTSYDPIGSVDDASAASSHIVIDSDGAYTRFYSGGLDSIDTGLLIEPSRKSLTTLIETIDPDIAIDKGIVFVSSSAVPGGDGTMQSPFCSIEEAETNTSSKCIALLPGLYPSIQLNSSRKIVSVGSVYSVESPTIVTRFSRDLWETPRGNTKLMRDRAVLTDGGYLKTSFPISSPASIRATINGEGSFVFIFGSERYNFVLVRSGNETRVGFTVGGLRHTSPVRETGPVYIESSIIDSKMAYSIKVNNVYYNRSTEIAPTADPVFVEVENTGSKLTVGSISIDSPIINSGNSNVIKKTVFGIEG